MECRVKLPFQCWCLILFSHFSFRVYTQMSQVANNLTNSRFQITDEEEEADIIWNFDHIKHYRSAVEQHTPQTHRHTALWFLFVPSGAESKEIFLDLFCRATLASRHFVKQCSLCARFELVNSVAEPPTTQPLSYVPHNNLAWYMCVETRKEDMSN